MWNILKSRPLAMRAARGVLTGLLLASPFGPAPSFARADAVDDLKQALQAREKDLANVEKLLFLPGKVAANLPPVVGFWREPLTKKIENLRTIGDLWGALALRDWKDLSDWSNQRDRKDRKEQDVANRMLREMDSDLRRQVGTRLRAAIDDVIKNGDANSRLALGVSIADRGPTIRSLTAVKGNQIVEEEPAGFMRTLTPQVIRLTGDKDLGVRQQAYRALGNIFPKPQDAVPIFQQALDKEPVELKRNAADYLGQLIRVASYLGRPGRPATDVKADPGDVLATVAAVLGGNGAALRSHDGEVRRYACINIQEAAQALADLILGSTRKDFPPEKRKLIDEEKEDILRKNLGLNKEIDALVPVLDALRKQGNALAANLKDPDSSVRLAAVDALENIGNARIRLKNRVLSVPVPEGDKAGDRGNLALLAAHDPLEGFVANNLSSIAGLLADPDVTLRLKTVEFLDVCEEAATPALPLLSSSLSDPNQFVRKSAARAIYNIAPEKAAESVRALAKLLSDPELSVRVAAAKTLKEMGPIAGAAVPVLAIAVVSGDTEGRVAAMEALQSIGPTTGKTAVPQLIDALSYRDPRVRRVAAKTLGGFGGAAYPALDALRRALGDEDSAVRVNASDAMLEIGQRREKY